MQLYEQGRRRERPKAYVKGTAPVAQTDGTTGTGAGNDNGQGDDGSESA